MCRQVVRFRIVPIMYAPDVRGTVVLVRLVSHLSVVGAGQTASSGPGGSHKVTPADAPCSCPGFRKAPINDHLRSRQARPSPRVRINNVKYPDSEGCSILGLIRRYEDADFCFPQFWKVVWDTCQCYVWAFLLNTLEKSTADK